MNGTGKRVKDYPFIEKSGVKVLMDIYYPENDLNEKKPILIYCHGGGWDKGDKSKIGVGLFKKVSRNLLRKGFAVCSIGYRKGNKYAIRDCVSDCQDAIKFLVSKKEVVGIDENKIFLFGDSAGGQIAKLISMIKCPNFDKGKNFKDVMYRIKACACWYSPVDFGNKSLDNKRKDRFEQRIMNNSEPEDKEVRYKEISPIRHISKDDPELLLVHGEEDEVIPFAHSEMIKNDYKKIGKEIELLKIKNAGHNFREAGGEISPNRDEIVKKTVNFFLKNKS